MSRFIAIFTLLRWSGIPTISLRYACTSCCNKRLESVYNKLHLRLTTVWWGSPLPGRVKTNCNTVEAAAAPAKSLQSCLTLCDPIDGRPPGFPVPGILQARTLEWVAISFSNAWKGKVKVKSSVLSDSYDPRDCSLSGSSIHGIFQARVLDWGAIACL